MGPEPPREWSAALRVRARASGAKRGGPPRRGPARNTSAGGTAREPAGVSGAGCVGEGVAELQRLFTRRLRACRSLGIPVPADARSGPAETLLHRVALLDRRIEVSLDLAGGRHFAPWEEPDEERPDPDWPDEAPPDEGRPEDDEDGVVETSS